jgi:hypothetical protein
MNSLEQNKLFIDSYKEGERLDCTVLALAAVAELPYADAHKLLASAGRVRRKGFRLFGWLDSQFHIHGVDPGFGKYRAVPVRMYEDITLAKVLRDFPRGRFLARQRKHAFAIIDGKAWNANGGNRVRVKKLWYFEKECA